MTLKCDPAASLALLFEAWPCWKHLAEHTRQRFPAVTTNTAAREYYSHDISMAQLGRKGELARLAETGN